MTQNVFYLKNRKLHDMSDIPRADSEYIAALEEALRPLVEIADRYDDDNLDQCRPSWQKSSDEDTLLFEGRGGEELLYLRDCLKARKLILARKATIHEHNVFDILALVRTEGDGRGTTVPFPKDLIRGYAAALARQALSELLRKKP